MFDNIKLIDENDLKKRIVWHRILKTALLIAFLTLLGIYIYSSLSIWGVLSILTLVWSVSESIKEDILSSRMETRLKGGKE